jgi:hypothetical protein
MVKWGIHSFELTPDFLIRNRVIYNKIKISKLFYK